jgi:hypothetical protein
MDYAPIARIVVRYIVGLVVGADTAGILAADPDVITIVAIGIGAAVEVIYTLAKKREWKL